MPKPKWGGAEKPTINDFYETDISLFREYALKSDNRRSHPQYHISTQVDSNITWRQMSSEI